MPKKRSFLLYLLSSDVNSYVEALTERAQQGVKSSRIKTYSSNTIGRGAIAYILPGDPRPPKWLSDLKPHFDIAENLYSKSPAALVGFEAGGRKFLLSYGHAHASIDFDKTEADFGLKVAINFVNENKIRGVEHSNLGLAVRDAAQAAGQKDLASFRVDDALDLIKKVTGYSQDNDFADVVTGSRALKFSKELELVEITDAANSALNLFGSKAYTSTPFGIIDFLSPEDNSNTVDALNQLTVQSIIDGEDHFEIGFPEFTPDEVCSFRFEGASLNTFHPDLTLEKYQIGLGERLSKLNVEDLKRHKVAAYDINQTYPMRRWSLFSSLIGSIQLGQRLYALNEGRWYRVDPDYKKKADLEFATSKIGLDAELGTFITKISGQGKRAKPGYESEEEYNSRIGNDTNLVCLDRKLIKISGVPGPGIEVCDLMDVERRRLIHVKKSRKSSSVLSHLFKQGTNSARLFKSIDFQNKVAERVEQTAGPTWRTKFQNEISSSNKWTVEYRIADHPTKDGDFSIPFFSRLSFSDEKQRMKEWDFDVKVGFIKLNRVN